MINDSFMNKRTRGASVNNQTQDWSSASKFNTTNWMSTTILWSYL
jgi:hypothetical protein